MGLFSWLRRSPKPATTFICVYLPEPIDTDERESGYGAPLTIELRLAGGLGRGAANDALCGA